MSVLSPAGGAPYDVIGMEYATTAALQAANAGPPAVTCVTGGSGSGITFETSDHVHGAKACKLFMAGAADINTYAKLSANLTAIAAVVTGAAEIMSALPAEAVGELVFADLAGDAIATVEVTEGMILSDVITAINTAMTLVAAPNKLTATASGNFLRLTQTTAGASAAVCISPLSSSGTLAALGLTAGATPGWDAESYGYEVSGWFKFAPDVPTHHGIVLIRFGSLKPNLAVRKVADGSYQLAVYKTDLSQVLQTEVKTNGTYPALTPNQWHYLTLRAEGFAATAAGAQNITWTATVDGTPVTFTGTAVTMTGYPAVVEVGCVRGVEVIGTDDSATVWIDDLRLTSGDTEAPPEVAVTTCLPVLDGQGGVTLCVGTNIPADVTVECGSATGDYTVTQTSAAATWHKVAIAPGAGMCYYRVTAQNCAQATDILVLPERSVTASHSATSSFTLGVIGDGQSFVTRTRAAYLLAQADPDLLLITGDLAEIQQVTHAVWDDLTEKEREQVLEANTGPLFQPTASAGAVVTLGNHDYVGAWNDLPASTDWIRGKLALPGDAVFDYGCARIITLEDMGGWTTSVMSAERLDWLKARLHESTAIWNIVMGHYPLYYSPNADPETLPQYVSRADVAAVLEANGANLYLSGHRHEFNRYASGGVLHVINSTCSDSHVGSGAYLNVPDGDRTPRAGSLRQSIHTGGYTLLTVKPESIEVVFRSRTTDALLSRYRLRQRAGGRRGVSS